MFPIISSEEYTATESDMEKMIEQYTQKGRNKEQIVEILYDNYDKRIVNRILYNNGWMDLYD